MVLVEDEEQSVDLASLEADYYGIIIERSDMHDHLTMSEQQVVSSGQCRSLTSRIPSADAALLSAAASKQITRALESKTACIVVGRLTNDGNLFITSDAITEVVECACDGGWQVRLPPRARARLSGLRNALGPNETGGALLGIVDHSRKRIEIVFGLRAPPDSVSQPMEFERGTHGLRHQIDDACARVMHQVSYIGEWHSHPDGSGTQMSSVDIEQLRAITADLSVEERPAVMVIVGQDEVRIHVGVN